MAGIWMHMDGIEPCREAGICKGIVIGLGDDAEHSK